MNESVFTCGNYVVLSSQTIPSTPHCPRWEGPSPSSHHPSASAASSSSLIERQTKRVYPVQARCTNKEQVNPVLATNTNHSRPFPQPTSAKDQIKFRINVTKVEDLRHTLKTLVSQMPQYQLFEKNADNSA